jgi:hypothetical protein
MPSKKLSSVGDNRQSGEFSNLPPIMFAPDERADQLAVDFFFAQRSSGNSEIKLVRATLRRSKGSSV